MIDEHFHKRLYVIENHLEKLERSAPTFPLYSAYDRQVIGNGSGTNYIDNVNINGTTSDFNDGTGGPFSYDSRPESFPGALDGFGVLYLDFSCRTSVTVSFDWWVNNPPFFTFNFWFSSETYANTVLGLGTSITMVPADERPQAWGLQTVPSGLVSDPFTDDIGAKHAVPVDDGVWHHISMTFDYVSSGIDFGGTAHYDEWQLNIDVDGVKADYFTLRVTVPLGSIYDPGRYFPCCSSFQIYDYGSPLFPTLGPN